MALFRKKKKEQTAEQSTPTEQEDVRPKFRIEYHSLVELSSDSLFYVSSFIEIIGQGFWVWGCHAPDFEKATNARVFWEYKNIPRVICSERAWGRLYNSEEEFLEVLRKSYGINKKSTVELKATSHSALCNSAYWGWFGKNSLAVHINKRADNDWYADLCSIYRGYEVYIKGDGILVGAGGDGKTPEEAFQNMLRRYSGETLRIPSWEGKEYKPIDIQFPIILT